ncbi:MAG: glycoside hydrolase family 3 C-terminal domain-containing protein [Christensenellaceae bacterium]|jgi:beta-glucosidase|nr:glycoside hydrolase family 3 C-terminal domain-containing protein [Christensenellaceae bacterium]
MSLEEMASQLRYDAPAIERLGIPAYNWWNEALHGVARAGTATVFPQAIGLAASFDEALLGEISSVIAEEGRAKYNAAVEEGDRDIYKGLTFWSPNINIFRDPRWGRGHETYGEDPFLTARLGVAFVKGLQGDGPYLKAAACAKHYAVHSGPEAIRHEFDARPSKKDLFETYLPAFEALVKEAKVEAVMGAYNRVNGAPANGSKELLVEILRESWGFEGHVVSDCWAIRDFHLHHHVTSTAPESAAMAIEAGCDVNCGNTYLHLLQAVQEGLVTKAQIATAAERLFTTRFMLGLFDEGCEFNQIPFEAIDSDAHADLALKAALESMVLLKNDGILPLNQAEIRSVAVIGPNANSVKPLEGNYHGTSSRYVSFLDGIRAALPAGVRLYFEPGSALKKEKSESLSQREHDRVSEAVAAARRADLSILILGLDETIEGEEGDSGDKHDLELPASQIALLQAVKATGKPFVTVVAAGSNLRVEDGNAILWAWYPGQAGGTALAKLLFGQVSPSGRLPLTFYRSADDLPDFADYSMQNRTYRYFGGEALYPFGYGLSYTRFGYANLSFDAAKGVARVTVKNLGERAGDEIVQLYLKDEISPFAPRNHSLRAFARVHLLPGESKAVELKLGPEAFELIDDEGRKVPGSGSYTLFIGGSQPDPLSLSLAGQSPLSLKIKQ